ncbi:hypothetical protein FXB40_01125 [Bradyrhizobium rifense]|uniref:Uncharacterized protein n=1 Tax=Bradyrhizobium rifense TaxID=515499 RepID=A0A5D3L1I3_9BRAD|nr:hypothetical protein [Bradyrhizobium rifense]TYM00142.1 hypothetical protein FXB40_01125 [Bradyrhizobium rifense]
MPRFFFNHTSHDDVSVDKSGTVFPSRRTPISTPCRAILDIAFEKLRDRVDPAEDEIISEGGVLLATIPFSEMLRPHHKGRTESPTEQLLAISARLIERNRTLQAQFNEEFARTEASFRTIRSNLVRLDAACSTYWPRAK